MQAHELDRPGPLASRPLQWREVAAPTPGAGQLVIAVVGCGVCRSNLHMIEGDWVSGGVPGISPIIPGHEVTGIVSEIGPDVRDFVVGDRVGVMPLWWTCETCENCRAGREQLCRQRKITGEHVNGGYAEYMLSNAAHTYHVPDGLDLVDIAPLFCPGITAFGAVDKLDVGPGDTVAIFGLGGVGHMAVQFAALTGARVIAVGRNRSHLDVAAELGAADTVDFADDAALAALAETADAVITCAPSDWVNAQAIRTLKWGGTMVSVVPLTVESLPFNKEQTVKASLLGTRAQMREVLRLAAEGKVRTVIDRFPLAEATSVLELLADGRMRSRGVLVS